MTELETAYDPRTVPAQQAFRSSSAYIRAYGGAMGGGKTRALCEEALDLALDYPGIPICMVRLRHNSITETTKKTMMEYVLPPALVAKKRESGGEDYVRLWNGSTIHFIGLDDPVKWFSSELGAIFFDEAHEIPEESVTKLMTRLRHPAAPVTHWKDGEPPLVGKVCLAFNPDNPGHWLYQWLFVDADSTKFGTYKIDLYPTSAEEPIGDAEFFFASPLDNVHLPAGYIRALKGQPEYLRRRYLEGLWEFIGGACFFNVDALEEYRQIVPEPRYRMDFKTFDRGWKARPTQSRNGKFQVFEPPAADLSYAVGADVATGRGKDFSAAYVVRLDEPKFVCEFHAKIDPDLFAEQLHFLGRWYGDALMAIETGGGYGEAVIIPLRDGKGPRPPYPRLYRHVLGSRPDLPTVKPFGFPMNSHTRPVVLGDIAKAIRERALPELPRGLLDECMTFAEHETGTSPRALEGCNDDRVFAAAIALDLYRQRGHHPDRHRPAPAQPKDRRTYPWQRRSRQAVAAEIEARYPKGT